MGSVDLPPFVREKAKQKAVEAKDATVAEQGVVPPFVKKKEENSQVGSDDSLKDSSHSLLNSSTNQGKVGQQSQSQLQGGDNTDLPLPTFSSVYSNVKDIFNTHFPVSADPVKAQKRKTAENQFATNNVDGIIKVRDAIVGDYESQRNEILSRNQAASFSAAPNIKLPIGVKKPSEQQKENQLKELDDKISQVNEMFRTVGISAIVNSKNYQGAIAAESNQKLGFGFSGVASEDIGAEVSKKFGIPRTTGNVKYDEQKAGIRAIAETYQLQANDLFERAKKESNPELEKQAQKKQELVNKYLSFDKNLIHSFPDVKIEKMSRLIKDAIDVVHPNKIFVSKNDVNDAVDYLEENGNSGIKKSMAGVIDVIAESEGSGFFGQLKMGLVPEAGFATGVLAGGLQTAEDSGSLVNLLSGGSLSEKMKGIDDRFKPQSYLYQGGSKSGISPVRVVYDAEGNTFKDIPNENYGSVNWNSASYHIANAIPGLADFIAKEQIFGAAIGAAGGGLSAAAKAAQFEKQGLKLYDLGGAALSAESKHFLATTATFFVGEYDRNKGIANSLIPDETPIGEAKRIGLATELSLINSTAFAMIGFSPSKFVADAFSKSISSDVMAAFEKNGWSKLSEKESADLLKKIVPKLKSITGASAESLKEGAKIATATLAGSQASQLVQQSINPEKAENVSADNQIHEFVKTSLVMGAIGGVTRGVGSLFSPSNRDILYDAGLEYPKYVEEVNIKLNNGEITQEDANKSISMLNEIGLQVYRAQNLTNNDGLKLTQKQKQDIAIENFRKSLAQKEADLGVDKERNEKIVKKADKNINDILKLNLHINLKDTHVFKSASELDEDGENAGKPENVWNISPDKKYKFETDEGEEVVGSGSDLLMAIPQSKSAEEIAIRREEQDKIQKAGDNYDIVKNSNLSAEEKQRFYELTRKQMHTFEDGEYSGIEPLNEKRQKEYNLLLKKALNESDKASKSEIPEDKKGETAKSEIPESEVSKTEIGTPEYKKNIRDDFFAKSDFFSDEEKKKFETLDEEGQDKMIDDKRLELSKVSASVPDRVKSNPEMFEKVGEHEGRTIYSTADAQAFRDSIAAAVSKRKEDRFQVDVHPVEKYQQIVDSGGKLFVSGDGSFGGYAQADGYMGSLFKNPEADIKGVAKATMDLIVAENGGGFFDAFGTHLEDIYIKNGFRPVARIEFNEEYAPEGWRELNLKDKPDVVFFSYDPSGKYKKGDGEYFTDWDEAYNHAEKINSENEKVNTRAEESAKGAGEVNVGNSEDVSKAGKGGKEAGKYEEKARAIADKILGANLPEWLVGSNDPNVQKAGFSVDPEAVKKALSEAVIAVGKLLDKGVELKDAIKEAVKGLVDLQGKENEDKIINGFTDYYNSQLKNEKDGEVKKEDGKEGGNHDEGNSSDASAKKEDGEKENVNDQSDGSGGGGGNTGANTSASSDPGVSLRKADLIQKVQDDMADVPARTWKEAMDIGYKYLEKRATKNGTSPYDEAQYMTEKWYRQMYQINPDGTIAEYVRGRIGEPKLKKSVHLLDSQLAILGIRKAYINERMNALKTKGNDAETLLDIAALHSDMEQVDYVLRGAQREAGRTLNFFNAIIRVGNDGKTFAKRKALSEIIGQDIPETKEQLDAALSKFDMSNKDQAKQAGQLKSAFEAVEKYKNEINKINEEQKANLDKIVEDAVNKKMQEFMDNYKRNFGKKMGASLKLSKDVKEKTLSQSGKDFADKLRALKFKQDPNTLQSNIFGLGVAGYNALIDTIAAIVEGGATLADAIGQAISKDTFKSEKDENEFINHLIGSSSTEFKREEVIGKISQAAKEYEELNKNNDEAVKTAIPVEAAQKGYIADLAHDYLLSGTVPKDVFDEVVKSLKDVLPDVTRNDVRDAYLKQGEYYTPTERELSSDEVQQKQSFKEAANLEKHIEALEAGAVLSNPEIPAAQKERFKSDYEAGLLSQRKALLEEKKADEASARELKTTLDRIGAEKKRTAEKMANRESKLRDALNRLKNRSANKKAESSDIPKELTDTEKDLTRQIDEEKGKWENEKKTKSESDKQYRELEAERNRQLKKVSELNDKIKSLSQGVRDNPKPKEKSSEKDTPEIEALKQEVEKANQELKRIEGVQKKAKSDQGKLETEIQRQLTKVSDLTKKRDELRNNIRQAAKKKSVVVDTPEIENLKKEVADADKELRKKETAYNKAAKKYSDTQDKLAEYDQKISDLDNHRKIWDRVKKDPVSVNKELAEKRKEVEDALVRNGITLEMGDAGSVSHKEEVSRLHNERVDRAIDLVNELITDELYNKDSVDKDRVKSLEGVVSDIKNTKVNIDREKYDDKFNRAEKRLSTLINTLDPVVDGDIRRELIEAKRQLLEDVNSSKERIKLKRAKQQLSSRINKAKKGLAALKNGDYSPVDYDVKLRKDDEYGRADYQRKLAEAEFRRARERFEYQNKTKTQKAIQMLMDFRRAEVISGMVGTFLKVPLSGLTKQPLDMFVNNVTSYLGTRQLATALGLTGIERTRVSWKADVKSFRDSYVGHTLAQIKTKVAADKVEFVAAAKNLKDTTAKGEAIKANNPDGRDSKEFKDFYEGEFKDAVNRFNKANLENSINFAYEFLDPRAWQKRFAIWEHDDTGKLVLSKDSIAMTGSTDFEENMGAFKKRQLADEMGVHSTKVGKGAEAILYGMELFGRIHGSFKDISARRQFMEGYIKRLEKAIENGEELNTAKRIEIMQRSFDIDFLGGKYQEKNKIAESIDKAAAAIDKKSKTQLGNITRNVLFPVLKVPLNIEGNALGKYALGLERGLISIVKEAKSVWKEDADIRSGKFEDDAYSFIDSLRKHMSELDPAYQDKIVECLNKGLVGTALMVTAGLAAAQGQLSWGGVWPGKKKKDAEGNTLDYGEFSFYGHRFGKTFSKVLGHIPEMLPVMMGVTLVNAHDEQVDKNEKLLSEGKSRKSPSESAVIEAANIALEESALQNISSLTPAKVVEDFKSSFEFRFGKDVSEFFDKDEDGNLIERKADNIGEEFLIANGGRAFVKSEQEKMNK